jgi:rubredoxin
MIPVLVIAVLALVLVACRITDGSDPNPQIRPGLDGSGTFPSFTTGGVERPTQPNGTEDDMTEPENSSDPSGEATEPTEPGVEATQPTNPGTGNEDPGEGTQPTNPGNEDTQPTDPGEDPTDPSEGGDPSDPTQPTQPTDPGVEDPTQPVDPTQPTAPPNEHTHDYKAVVYPATCTTRGYTIYTCRECGHNYAGDWKPATGHNYQKISTKKPTCTEKGYSTYRCDACGDTYTEETPATGHNYSKKVTEPTCTKEGYTTYTCKTCGYSYTGDKVSATGHLYKSEWTIVKKPTATEKGVKEAACWFCDAKKTAYIPALADAATEYEAAVAKAVLKYINQFRAEEGKTQLTYLPGMSQVAQYRSRQLVTNLAHDVDEMREACGYYEYGRYVNWADYGCPDLVDQNHWVCDSQEAIGGGIAYDDPDDAGYDIARRARESTSHWNYLSSNEYSFSGIGITFEGGSLYCCIMVGRTNYG